MCVECYQLLRPTELGIARYSYIAFVFATLSLVSPPPSPPLPSQVGGDALSDIPTSISRQRIFIKLRDS